MNYGYNGYQQTGMGMNSQPQQQSFYFMPVTNIQGGPISNMSSMPSGQGPMYNNINNNCQQTMQQGFGTNNGINGQPQQMQSQQWNNGGYQQTDMGMGGMNSMGMSNMNGMGMGGMNGMGMGSTNGMGMGGMNGMGMGGMNGMGMSNMNGMGMNGTQQTVGFGTNSNQWQQAQQPVQPQVGEFGMGMGMNGTQQTVGFGTNSNQQQQTQQPTVQPQGKFDTKDRVKDENASSGNKDKIFVCEISSKAGAPTDRFINLGMDKTGNSMYIYYPSLRYFEAETSKKLIFKIHQIEEKVRNAENVGEFKEFVCLKRRSTKDVDKVLADIKEYGTLKNNTYADFLERTLDNGDGSGPTYLSIIEDMAQSQGGFGTGMSNTNNMGMNNMSTNSMGNGQVQMDKNGSNMNEERPKLDPGGNYFCIGNSIERCIKHTELEEGKFVWDPYDYYVFYKAPVGIDDIRSTSSKIIEVLDDVRKAGFKQIDEFPSSQQEKMKKIIGTEGAVTDLKSYLNTKIKDGNREVTYRELCEPKKM